MPYIVQTRDDKDSPWSDPHEATEYATLELASAAMLAGMAVKPNRQIREWCNGFANRETYTAHLHLTAVDFYNRHCMAQAEIVQQEACKRTFRTDLERETWASNVLGERIKHWIEDLVIAPVCASAGEAGRSAPDTAIAMVWNVGSFDRVNWREAARYFITATDPANTL